MKRLFFCILLSVLTLAASAQTGLYKRYASRPGVQAYCVERYPLSGGDSACVTLLQTDDSAVYRTLCRELYALPYTTTRLHIDGTISIESDGLDSHPKMPDEAMRQIRQMKQKADSLQRHWRERKHLVVFNVDGLPGDRGHYAIYCPSDRMVILAFLVASDAESLKVAAHMMSTEFETKK